MAKKKRQNKKSKVRPPIVTIMGHVDHGKTTLLDAIRESHLVESEHGGITQHIGAYQISHKKHKITFIDTPGHAAFSKMRQRGANITDIVVLVVAANDGVKPQTIESIKHIKTANAQVVVAINKIDLPGASPDMVKAQLTEHKIFVEGYGGQTPAIELSAIKKQGINELLEMILLIAELQELTLKENAPLEAVVIESKLDKHRGPMASVIVKTGNLNTSDTVFIESNEHKVRALFNDHGDKINTAKPGDPVTIMGLKQVPEVGSVVTDEPQTAKPILKENKVEDAPSDKEPEEAADSKDTKEDAPSDKESEKTIDSEDVKEKEERPAFNLILKADTPGTLEAIIQSAIHDEVTLVLSGIGPVSESDVLLAQSTKSLIISFNVPIASSAQTLAQLEKVTIKQFNIIYKLIEFLEEKILTLIEPTINEEELGVAEIIASFEIRGEFIAGCKVKSGTINKNYPIHLVRNDKIIKDSKIKSLKKGKEDIKTVKSGSECGIILQPSIDFKVGDTIKSYRTIED